MRRVAVIGGSGAGKSWFSTALAAATGLPLVHLDAEYWRPGWVQSAPEDWRARHDALIAGDAWIIDGNFGGTLSARLARADTVFWFDLPTADCLAGVVRRRLVHWGRTRPDMAPGCPERLDRKFLTYVATFRRVHRPRIVAALEAAAAERGAEFAVHRITRRAEARRHLDRCAEAPRPFARLAGDVPTEPSARSHAPV